MDPSMDFNILMVPADYRQENNAPLFHRTLEDDDELWSDDENFVVRDRRPERNRLLPLVNEQLLEPEPQLMPAPGLQPVLEPQPQFMPKPEPQLIPEQMRPAVNGRIGICIICMVNPIDRCIYPCCHYNVCEGCILRWIREQGPFPVCPTCNTLIFEILTIYQ